MHDVVVVVAVVVIVFCVMLLVAVLTPPSRPGTMWRHGMHYHRSDEDPEDREDER